MIVDLNKPVKMTVEIMLYPNEVLENIYGIIDGNRFIFEGTNKKKLKRGQYRVVKTENLDININ